MSYLICKKCGGHYKLKDGESPEDFESCECGGDLNYVQNLNSHFSDELNICPECGTRNLQDEKICKSCEMKSEKTQSNSNKEKNVNEFNTKKVIIRISGIILGILIVLIPNFLLTNQNYALILLLIGGFVSSIISGRNNEERALNGTIVGLVAGLILLVFRGNIFLDNEISYLGVIIFEMMGPLVILAIFGLFGGIIDILIKYLYWRYQNRQK